MRLTLKTEQEIVIDNIKSQWFSILASVSTITRKIHLNKHLNIKFLIDNLAAVSTILSRTAHRLHEHKNSRFTLRVTDQYQPQTAFLNLFSYNHLFILYRGSLSHFFVFFLSFKVACEMKNLIFKSSIIVIMIFFINFLIFVKKGSRFNKCIIILLKFLCSFSKFFSTISFCSLIELRFIHIDIIFKLIVILANWSSTLFSCYTYIYWKFLFLSQVAQLQDVIEFPISMNSMR